MNLASSTDPTRHGVAPVVEALCPSGDRRPFLTGEERFDDQAAQGSIPCGGSEEDCMKVRNEQTGEEREVAPVRTAPGGDVTRVLWPGGGEYAVKSGRLYKGKTPLPWVMVKP